MRLIYLLGLKTIPLSFGEHLRLILSRFHESLSLNLLLLHKSMFSPIFDDIKSNYTYLNHITVSQQKDELHTPQNCILFSLSRIDWYAKQL